MILVAGATGQLGSEIARRLLGRGNKVRALARQSSDPTKVDALLRTGAELAVQCVDNPVAHNAVIPFGGPEPISQREAVKIFEEEFGKPFTVNEVPEHALEAQWKGTENPMEKSFASLMLAVARGFDTGIEPPFEKFPMRLTTPRDFVRRMAKTG